MGGGACGDQKESQNPGAGDAWEPGLMDFQTSVSSLGHTQQHSTAPIVKTQPKRLGTGCHSTCGGVWAAFKA